MRETNETTLHIRVFGIVQGVGFRPTVSRHAMENQIRGSVCNKGSFVEIWAQGEQENVDNFCKAIEERPPERAVILKIHREKYRGEPPVFSAFSIIESEKKRGDIFVSPDIAICEKCKEEMYDRQNRRYLHPFINCTCCGPRLTILDAMPYDRERTSMADFPMCPDCAWEYTHAQSRRYDAQPVCCNDCGPQVYLLPLSGKEEKITGREAIRQTREIIARGGIVAIKGIGGFHLCCDAANEEAVSLLRQRKKRPAKPLAVMMKNRETVERECVLTEKQREILEGHQKPILLLEKQPGGRIAPSVAPGNPKVGVMLPYAPIQLLLFDAGDDLTVSDCLVMTSANTSGAPICREDADAQRELTHLCDGILSHDRLIRIRADDTVMDFFRGEPYMIRRSRGYAPLPFMVGEDWEGEVLALGGELKNTFCVGKNTLFYPSSYIGDMGDLRTVRAWEESSERLCQLLETEPEIVACDLHPGYNTTALAEKMGKPLLKIQHHYAHILSCMAENDWNAPVIGIALDGTGYGTDGTIWGGEILTADYEGFVRQASVHPFLHVGGDAASREGWRIALSLLRDLYGQEEMETLAQQWQICSGPEARVLGKMAEKKINSVISTSAGRIFDAVSALLGIAQCSTFEGEASIALQFAAERYEKENRGRAIAEKVIREEKTEPVKERTVQRAEEGAFVFPEEKKSDTPEFWLDTHGLVRQLVEGRKKGENPEKLAWYFHQRLAEMLVEACGRIREKTGISAVALSGGVYQNLLLLRLTLRGLEREGFSVLTHHLTPPNDGGICLGQAAAAMYALQKNRKTAPPAAGREGERYRTCGSEGQRNSGKQKRNKEINKK